MKTFDQALKDTKEVGEVEQVLHSILYIKGLPGVRSGEVVVFESGEMGEVLSLTPEIVEVLLLTNGTVRVGDRVARTNDWLSVDCTAELLGQTLDPLGQNMAGPKPAKAEVEARPIDIDPPDLQLRKDIDHSITTGVSIVDLVVPLGRGQRELVIGDHKIGKTAFLLQAMQAQAIAGGITVYCGIAKRWSDIQVLQQFVARHTLEKNSVIVTSHSRAASGMIFLTPYTAMTIAEYFRDAGKDVLLILDDLTIHAKYWREITLLARRFPGRSAYPGDIFHIHAKLLERAGNFTNGSITCLPVAETVLGDISGYIQTNLMSMTDGHIYFDTELFNQGRRPAINPFLSVTRVGHQTQTPLLKSLSRELSSFLVNEQKLKQLVHFGGELNDRVKKSLDRGERVAVLFNQQGEEIMPVEVAAVFLATVWADFWEKEAVSSVATGIEKLRTAFFGDERWRNYVLGLMERQSFDDLVGQVKLDKNALMALMLPEAPKEPVLEQKPEPEQPVQPVGQPAQAASAEVPPAKEVKA